ncbi:hypothetical protein QFZ46_000769 [Microbacterium murale]|uniref:Uncharacterized protein n=1 Tax=Microbacterium murale TaxID=1081040 RepID=A0ABU0P7H4_9MICO|nr:hypothetical protein [Microbacterium murale]
MSRPWSKGRIAFLVLGVICVAVGLFLIIPALGA